MLLCPCSRKHLLHCSPFKVCITSCSFWLTQSIVLKVISLDLGEASGWCSLMEKKHALPTHLSDLSGLRGYLTLNRGLHNSVLCKQETNHWSFSAVYQSVTSSITLLVPSCSVAICLPQTGQACNLPAPVVFVVPREFILSRCWAHCHHDRFLKGNLAWMGGT